MKNVRKPKIVQNLYQKLPKVNLSVSIVDLKETESEFHPSTLRRGSGRPELDKQNKNNTANYINKWGSTTTEEQINYWAVKLDVKELQILDIIYLRIRLYLLLS